jgi:hypothetical protein
MSVPASTAAGAIQFECRDVAPTTPAINRQIPGPMLTVAVEPVGSV